MKRFFGILSLILLLAIGITLYLQYPRLKVLNGYAARTACSCAFVANRKESQILSEDLGMSPFQIASVHIDSIHKLATSSVMGLAKKTAIYKPGIGCILLKGEDNHHVNFPSISKSDINNYQFVKSTREFPQNIKKEIIQLVFDENREIVEKKTRALLVLYNDSLLIEEYAKGINADTRLLGWSMTKSVINALTGILVKQGKIEVKDKNLFGEWKDERKNISLESMLRMTSGIKWNEDYATESEATNMLFDSENIADFAKNHVLDRPVFNYSSGSTNMVTQVLRNKFSSLNDFLLFPHTQLFNKLSMESAIIETDESGLFIGSSYMYAHARDWMRFGRLYLKNGNWQGEQILPEDWVDFTTRETPESEGRYGAHFWLNKRGIAYPDAPH
ncbi:MAG: hypothetical protein RLZZ546_3036, partial [Bacteroidota bacterium]